METVADALERYKELKENFNKDISEMKNDMSDIKSEIIVLREIISEFKSDVKALFKEFDYFNKRHEENKREIGKIAEGIAKCRYCNSSIDLDALNVRASRAYTIATISITFNVVLLGIIANLAFKQ